MAKQGEAYYRYSYRELSAFCLQISLLLEAAVPLAGLRADNAPAVLAALPGAYRAQFQLLPYRAVGKESGLLLAFRPERAARDGVPWQGLAAISPERVANGQYEGLIGL